MNRIGSLLCAVALGFALPAASLAAPVAVHADAAVFTSAAPMHHARAFQTTTELVNGDILVAGGYDGSVFLTGGSAPPVFPDSEIYDWHTGAWTSVKPMNVARAAAVAVRLPDGRVLVVGGFDSFFNGIGSAEIYDPRANSWTLTGPMHSRRAEDFVATLLPGGRVLVAGGYLRGFPFTPLSSTEIWDPRTNQWTVAAPMNSAHAEAGWNKLKDGRVLVTGGEAVTTPDGTAPPVATAEIFNPAAGTWTLTGSMNFGRLDHSQVLLVDGRTLVAGGEISFGPSGGVRTTTAELYDPQSGTWSLTGSMTAPRSESEWATVRLPNGQVLDTGGFIAEETPQASADLYDPATGTWSSAGSMSTSRAGHTAVVLRGNRGVLVVGGLFVPPSSTASVDIFR